MNKAKIFGVLLLCGVASHSYADERNFESESVFLTEKQLVELVAEENEAVRRQKIEIQIADQGITNALSIFEPTWNASYETEYGHEQNAADLRVQRSSSTTYQHKDRNYSTSIEGLSPIGTEFELFYEMKDPSNSLQTDAEFGHEYQAKAGVRVTQPLLKNFGLDANLANYEIATKEKKISQQVLRRVKMERVYQGLIAYADLQLAETRAKNELELLNLEKQGSAIVQNLASQGRLDRGAVFQAENDLAMREARLEVARKRFFFASNNIRRMLVGTDKLEGQFIHAADPINEDVIVDQSSRDFKLEAFEKRPEFVSAELQYALEKDRVDYSDNQRLPDLNLIGEIGKTGMSDTGIEAHKKLGSTYKFWSVGVELSVPMVGGLRSKSAYNAALMRREQAELSLRSLEGQINAEMKWAEYEVQSTLKEMQRFRKIVENTDASLKDLKDKIASGKANQYELLQKESELLQSQMSFSEKIVAYRKAALGLLLAQGRLLEEYDMEIREGV